MTTNRRGLNSTDLVRALAAATGVVLAIAAGACSVSFGSGGDSRACERFTGIATEIESDDTSAPGLKKELERIRSEASSDDQDDVASAADDLLSAVEDDDSSSLYQGLGAIEAACGPYGY